MTAATEYREKTSGMSREERKVVFASSLGTVFEWYDFFLYGSLSIYIGAAFFSQYSETTRNIFALLAFATGFLVRPFGALVFGRMGDMLGRKYTFLVTIVIMGLSTFLVGLLPGSASIGILAPIILIILRMLQGLALGGEYGGAATYVAEHSPDGKRGYYTSWIQTTATAGLLLSLLVIFVTRSLLGSEAFAAWGWRIPFIISVILLAISVWIRMMMSESPAFKKLKEEGRQSKAPITEAFGTWKNVKVALLALFGLTSGLGVVWYTAQFYALFFLQGVLKVDPQSVTILMAIALLAGSAFFVIFGWLSDKIGRKGIIMAGMVLSALLFMPIFKALTWSANPALAQAQESVTAVVSAPPGDCTFQFDPVGTARFTTSCDIATSFLARYSAHYDVAEAPTGGLATVKIGNVEVPSYDGTGADAKAKGAQFAKQMNLALQAAGYPLIRSDEKVAEQRLDTFIAANPELKLDAAAVRQGASEKIPAEQAIAKGLLTPDETAGDAEATVYTIPGGGAFKMVANPDAVNWPLTVLLLFSMVVLAAMVYGPMAAMLVEMFPIHIRYTGMSLPYHLGNGVFGGLLPATVFAMSAAQGDMYFGLWYPIVIAAVSAIVGIIFLRETKDVDITK